VGKRKPNLVKLLLDAVSMKQSPAYAATGGNNGNEESIGNKVDFGLLRYAVNEVSQVRLEARMKDLVFRCTTLLETAIDSYLLNNQAESLRQVLFLFLFFLAGG